MFSLFAQSAYMHVRLQVIASLVYQFLSRATLPNLLIFYNLICQKQWQPARIHSLLLSCKFIDAAHSPSTLISACVFWTDLAWNAIIFIVVCKVHIKKFNWSPAPTIKPNCCPQVADGLNPNPVLRLRPSSLYLLRLIQFGVLSTYLSAYMSLG